MQARTRVFLTVTASLFLTVGCAHNYGADSISDVGRFFELDKGESSKVDVYELFGQPIDVVEVADGSLTYWKYIKTKSQMNAATYIPFVGLVFGGDNQNVTTAVFYFDKGGTFTKLETFDKERYQNMWVALGKVAGEANEMKDARIRVAVEMDSIGKTFDIKSFNQQYQTDELKGT